MGPEHSYGRQSTSPNSKRIAYVNGSRGYFASTCIGRMRALSRSYTFTHASMKCFEPCDRSTAFYAIVLNFFPKYFIPATTTTIIIRNPQPKIPCTSIIILLIIGIPESWKFGKSILEPWSNTLTILLYYIILL